MKVEMIGTGSIWTKYNSSCALINDNIILDVPNGVAKQLLKSEHKVEEIRTILITHMHGDHIADLPFLLLYICFYSKVESQIEIIGPVGLKKKIEDLFICYNFKKDLNTINKTEKIKYIEIEERKDYNINNYNIKPILVCHGDEYPAYGYIINNKLGFSGDTSLCDGVEEIILNTDITILDSSYIIGNKQHIGIDNIEYLFKKYNKRIVATHLRDDTRQILRKRNFKKLIVPEDGYKFEI